MRAYVRFALMIATATVVMYLLTYLNTYVAEHIAFSEMRSYMALLMAAAMAAVMLGFMWGMYKNSRLNLAILAGAALLFAVALALVRSQALVDDASYMKAMIPHHSIAILASRRAQIEDPRVRDLADRIIETQEREIAQMKALLADLETRD